MLIGGGRWRHWHVQVSKRILWQTQSNAEQVISLFAQIALTISVAWGTGNYINLLTAKQQTNAVEWNWIGQIVTLLSTGFGKIAIIYFLLRIQEGTNKKSAWFLHFTGWSNMVLNIIQVVLILLQCSPTPKLWNNALAGTCNEKERTNTAGYFRGGTISPTSTDPQKQLLTYEPSILGFWRSDSCCLPYLHILDLKDAAQI